MINTPESFNNKKQKILKIIDNTVKNHNIVFDGKPLENLAVHLSIALIRIQSKNYIDLSKREVLDLIDANCFEAAKSICEQISSEFDVEIPENEASACALYISQADPFAEELFSSCDLLDKEVYDLVTSTFETIEKVHGRKFSIHDKIFTAIGLHMQTTVDRICNGQQLDNPLKQQIMNRHPQEFSYSKVLGDEFYKMYQKQMSDDELAFIALHFVVACMKEKA